MLQRLPVRRLNFADDVGFHQLSAVDDGVRRHHHLNRRERDGLSEADARQVHAFDVPRRDEDARRLPRQVNARLFAQPERRQVAVERIRPHPQRQLDKHRVAAVFQPICHRLRAVRPSPAADGVAVNGDFRRAVERILRRCHPAVQRGCRRENFERAARLVNVGNRGQAHQLRQRLRVVARRIVRVVAWVHAHRQNRARFHVADKADDRLRLIDLDALAHRLFDHLLNFRVNRQHQTAPLLRRDVPAFRAVQLPIARVHLPQIAALRAAQNILIAAFQPGLPLAVHRRQAQHLAEQRSIWVVAADILVKGQRLQAAVLRRV